MRENLPRKPLLVFHQPLNRHMRIYVTPVNGRLGYSSVVTIQHAAAKVILVCTFWGMDFIVFAANVSS